MQTTERYPGRKQPIRDAVNDHIAIEPTNGCLWRVFGVYGRVADDTPGTTRRQFRHKAVDGQKWLGRPDARR
jgi:hypothetical protein